MRTRFTAKALELWSDVTLRSMTCPMAHSKYSINAWCAKALSRVPSKATVNLYF